jgi:2,3-bisphosphoglycerate-dependent phosphoglycerate mutase
VAHIDFYVKNTMWTGGEDFWLHSFFSTIAYQLERDGWGSRFPALMNELYAGRLPLERVPEARAELETIRSELQQRPPDARVFAYEEPDRATPWPVPPGASSLADSFLTANGKNMLDLLARALDGAEQARGDVEIKPLEQPGTHNYFVTGER